jgi:glycine betaine/choline ABC-type transport system substrate-binding protein
LVDALDAGDVDAFGGFSESGRLFKFNLDIFVDDVNFRTTPGAATLVPP